MTSCRRQDRTPQQRCAGLNVQGLLPGWVRLPLCRTGHWCSHVPLAQTLIHRYDRNHGNQHPRCARNTDLSEVCRGPHCPVWNPQSSQSNLLRHSNKQAAYTTHLKTSRPSPSEEKKAACHGGAKPSLQTHLSTRTQKSADTSTSPFL